MEKSKACETSRERAAFIRKIDKLNGLGKNKNKIGDKDEKKEEESCNDENETYIVKEVCSARKNGKKWEYGVKFTGYDGRIHWLPWSNLNESCRECSFSSWCFSFTKTEHSFLQKYVTPWRTVGWIKKRWP